MTLTTARQFNDRTLSELESVLLHLSDQQYVKAASPLSDSIGAHVRHIIEFYHCFFKGLDYGVIDYDNRPRNSELETSTELAKDYLENIRLLLSAQDMSHYPDSVAVVACTDTDNPIETGSNIVRELLFLQSHTTHHLALIALLLEQEGIKVPIIFGVAASTRAHRQTA
jgi:uncharacterized damage-inducible protein DinB